MSLLLPFTDSAAVDPKLAGGKGANLATLTQRGFPVPSGVAVTPHAYVEFAAGARDLIAGLAAADAEDRARIHDASRRIREALETALIPSELEERLRAWHEGVKQGSAFAVRSSGTMEDTAEAAFAGQHNTFLNCVGADEILAKVKRCWMSLWEERAIAYRARLGFDHAAAAMAVVVQEMVQADVAGVAFSIDPVSGALDRAVVNANFGLGESVVSGEGEVDHFAIEKETGRVVERRIARKTVRVVATAQGTEERHVEGDEAERPALTDEQLAGLVRLLVKVEQSYGWPQDIEWAIRDGALYLLQSRPVTTIPPRWTRDESAERFPNVIAPFTWDCVEEGFHRSLNHSFALMGLPRFEGKWFALFNHYVYGNQNAVELYARRSPVAVTALADVEKLLPVLTQRFQWVATLPKRWHRDLPAYLDAIGALLAEPLDDYGPRELWRYVERVNRLGSDYFLPNIAISIGHGLLHRSLERLLSMAVGETRARELTAVLVAHETMTTQVNAGLRELASLAKGSNAFAARLRSTGSRVLLAERGAGREDGEGASFWLAFDAFVREHGHRETDFDAYQPTWIETPWVVLDHVRAFLDLEPVAATAGEGEDPGANAERAVRREALEAEIRKRAPEGLRDFGMAVIRLAREFTALDDLEHYHTTRLTVPLRRGMRALGERVRETAGLEDPMDLFFARKADLARAVELDSPAEWRALAAALRRTKSEFLAARDRAPEWELGKSDASQEAGQASPAAGVLAGIPGGPGTAEGPVFIVRTVDDFPRFPKGAVLVARTTNPAWTPLFYSAAAVVTESGGALSHGAVTAREMGIPAVMSVRGVLSVLRDGETVRVDGGAGTVTQLADQPQEAERRAI
ncbi:MAG: PEP/pyruvate-binding domain-containing protein [Thermoanaerobaculia bacterium]